MSLFNSKQNIYQILETTIVTIVATVISVIIAKVIDLYIPSLKEIKILLYTLLVLLIFLIILKTYKKIKFNNIYLPRKEDSYKILEEHWIHKIVDTHQIEHIRHYHLKAKKNNLKSFKSKFRWEGDSHTLSTPIKGHYIRSLGENDSFDHFEVVFNRTLLKGDLIRITIHWNLFSNTPLPMFISNMIYEETDKLIMRVEFPDTTHSFNEFIFEESINRGEHVIKTQLNNLSGDLFYQKVIDYPKLYHFYEIRWI